MYAIVEFVKTKEIDFIPWTWVIDETLPNGVSELIRSKLHVKVYWPPMRAPANVSRAKDQCMSAEVGWPTYMARILGTASEWTYE
jgi:hypothetical protein